MTDINIKYQGSSSDVILNMDSTSCNSQDAPVETNVEQNNIEQILGMENLVLRETALENTTAGSSKVLGQCKWFNDRLGYGFITIHEGIDKGKDVFVHHSCVKPQNNHYKSLTKGEYVHFLLSSGPSGSQAVDVTGINGGTLLCDHALPRRTFVYSASPQIGGGYMPQNIQLQQQHYAHTYTQPPLIANGRSNTPPPPPHHINPMVLRPPQLNQRYYMQPPGAF